MLCSIERHLEKIKRKAIKADYQDNTMIVSGVESLLNVCKYNHDSEGHIYFTIMLITNILPRSNSFYELVADRAPNGSGRVGSTALPDPKLQVGLVTSQNGSDGF